MAPQVTSPVRSLAHDVWRAFAHPGRAWGYLRGGALLARHAGLPLAEVLRYRRELRDDREFQAHLERSKGGVHCGIPAANALRALVGAGKRPQDVGRRDASGISSAHILR